MAPGRFITFEGGEGVGKTTQLRHLADRLGPHAPELVVTREPGGSPGAEALRTLLVRGDADRWSPLSETLILYAAREDHLERTIRPALARGAWVLCDRFADSTRAYQGAAGGADVRFIAELEAVIVGSTRPVLTVMLDLPAEVGLARARGRGGGETRFEDKGLPFHRRLRQAFLDIAADDPHRCVVVDATAPAETVAERVWTAAAERLGLPA